MAQLQYVCLEDYVINLAWSWLLEETASLNSFLSFRHTFQQLKLNKKLDFYNNNIYKSLSVLIPFPI